MQPSDHPPRPTQLARQLLREVIRAGDTVADATAGNGHDTLFLAECVGPDGRVLAFDVQECAIRTTRGRLENAGMIERVGFFQSSHARIGEHAPPGSLAAIMFNLGYLPGGDHQLTTEAAETLFALQSSVISLKSGGLLTVVCYPGHSAGEVEACQVEEWLAQLPATEWRVAKYAMLATRSPAPILFYARKP